MKKRCNLNGLAILLLALLTLLCMGVTGALAKDFDFKKTEAFVREIETRPDFPVVTVFARNYVYSIVSLGGKIDDKKKQAIESFIKSNQKIDGGFGNDKHDKESSILYTDYALGAFSLVNLPPSTDLARAKTFILSLRNADGGFAFSAKEKESSLVNTYMAIHSLGLLDSLSLVDAAKTAAFIKGFQLKDGGFSYVKGTGVATAKHTYMAVYALKALGKLDDATRSTALKYLNSSPYGKESTSKADSLHMLEEMDATIDALKLLGAKDKIDKKKAQKILKQLYISVNGGFGPLPGYGSTPDSTFLGLHILTGMGSLKEPIVYPLVKK